MRIGTFKTKESFQKVFKERLKKTYYKSVEDSTIRERYNVLGTLVREEIANDWIKTNKMLETKNAKKVYYFSMEFLLGRLITNNIISLGIRDVCDAGFNEMGLDINEVENYASDPGLGNGGLGRLAACYLDSMASTGILGDGECIRYRYGLFRQKINNGYQEERPDNWLNDGYVWEVRREEESVDIPFYGNVAYEKDHYVYRPAEYIRAIPYEVPIVGSHNGMVNNLRLWSAEPSKKYPENISPLEYETSLRQISGFLYPDDTTAEGKILRLKQQYFLAAAGIKNITRKHKQKYGTLENFPDYVVLHINDTHPTLLIPELMRILLDEENMGWNDAWNITSKVFAYTNHTILAEALEKWSIEIFKPLLPRIYQIIEEINRRFTLSLLEKYGYAKSDLINKLAIIGDGKLRMANLCVVTSFSVNGVAKLHTDILKNIEMKDFYKLYPDKFHNVTNGVTHRRWLLYSNQELASLIESKIGDGFKKNLNELEKLLPLVDDKAFQNQFLEVKALKKKALADKIFKEQGILIDPNSIFDIQVKRLHEYKRQLLNALHIMSVYENLKTSEKYRKNYVPHTFIFGAKAAGTYYFAKKVIKLINTIAKKVNNDIDTNKYLKVIFVENYNVSYAEIIMPACDISEQISTASKEASGTGNMKFMMNGALTLGTLDGANVEIHDLVGDDNTFIFGLTAKEVNNYYQNGGYNPKELYDNDSEIKMLLDRLVNGFFKDVDKNEFKEIFDKIVYTDRYFVLKDFEDYRSAQSEANEAYKDKKRWAKMALTNIAKSGVFSSDRSVKEYSDMIWKVKPII